MLELFNLINIKYIYIISTLGIIGIISAFKNSRSGIIASIIGITIISIIWGILKIFDYLKSSMKSEGVDYSMVLDNAKAIFIAFGLFFVLVIIYYIIIFLKNSRKKKIARKRRRRKYF